MGIGLGYHLFSNSNTDMGDDLMKWTYGQFTHAMNRAGWRSIGQGCYVHQQTKHKFYALTFEPRIQDVAWKEWAKVERTPAPFDE
jgi:hypothetical protein